MPKRDYLEYISRVITLITLSIALVACVAAPMLAIAWSLWPFPGFMVERTLVVNDVKGKGWSGQESGIDFPQHVTRIGGRTVATAAEYNAIITSLNVGDRVSVFTTWPDGSERLYPAITMTSFSIKDLVRLFWAPYLVGVIYLAIGVWIYRLKGMTRPGRALAFFCFVTSISCVLFFDAASTFVGAAFWMLALAQMGGALVSLSLRFPEEWRPVEQRPWLLGLPYGISIALALWVLYADYIYPDPWANISARYAIYVYILVGIALFLGMMVYRARTGISRTVKRQARIVLLGSALAFAPMTIWFLGTLVSASFYFELALLLSPLILFPISVAIAIFRYRLLEVDALVNRTLLYGALTAIVAGMIAFLITASQRFFMAMTGQKSDVAVVITTLIVVSAVEPIRARMRAYLDKMLMQAPDETRELRSFGDEVRAFLQVSDAEQIGVRLLEEAARSLKAQSGALSLTPNGYMRPLHTVGQWRGEAWMSIPLEWEGERYGLLSLGPRQSEKQYTRQECEVLQQVATQVAGAVHRASVVHGLPVPHH